MNFSALGLQSGGVDSGVARGVACLVGPRESLLEFGIGAGHGPWLQDCSSRPARHELFSNFCNASTPPKPADWVLSIDIAEHLPATCLPTYFQSLTTSAKKGLVLSVSSDRYARGHRSAMQIDQVEAFVKRQGFDSVALASDWLRTHATTPSPRSNVRVYVRKNASTARHAFRATNTTTIWAPHGCPISPSEWHKAWRSAILRSLRSKACAEAERIMPCHCVRANATFLAAAF